MKIVSRFITEKQKRKNKLKASPSQKENINLTSQKYQSIIKQKKNSTKKRKEEKLFKRKDNKNIITTLNLKGNKSFSKKSSPVSKIINHSFTKIQQINADKNIKQFLSKTPKPEKKKIEFKQKFGNQKNKKQKNNWFRSPPLAQKNQKDLGITYNSTGQLQNQKESKIQQQSKNKKQNFSKQNIIVETTDNIKVNSHCFEHPKKLSKYYLQKVVKIQVEVNHYTEVNQGICSKCSISYKKKGIDLFIVKNKQKQIRKNRIENFLQQLSQVQQNCFQNEQTIRNKYQELNSNYEKQTEKLNDYFKVIYQHLEQQRNFIAKKLEKNILKNKELFESSLNNYSECQNVLGQISTDIEQHYDNIIDKLDMEPFNKILSKYTEKLDFYKDQNNSKIQLECKNAEVNIHNNANDVIKQLNLKIDLIKSTQTLSLSLRDNNETLQQLKSESILESGFIEPKNLENQHKIKSEVYISFDDKFQKNSQFESKETDRENNLSQRYSQILQKINNSQKSKTEFYQNILKNNSQNFENEIQFKANDLNSISNDKEENSSQDQDAIFEINREDQENWIMKQTPDLQQKIQPPIYIQSYLHKIQDQNMDQKISKNISENLQKQSFNCQKTLFQLIIN